MVQAAGIDDFAQVDGRIAGMMGLALGQHTQLEKHPNTPVLVFIFS
jgi:hypothetical protein